MKESHLYFFYTVGCGWCKKVMPIIDELNNEGHNILKLDLAEKENKEIVEDLKKKHKIQCGTPLFVDAETGNNVCGFREKDILLKWIEGEKIPPPPRPKGPMPRPPFHEAKKKEINEWKKEYEKWSDENSHLPNIIAADKILERPRPKSNPPPPPQQAADDKTLERWKKEYEAWSKENKHLPNLLPVDQIMQRLKAGPQQQPGSPQMGPGSNPMLENRIVSLETKIDKLMNHLGVR